MLINRYTTVLLYICKKYCKLREKISLKQKSIQATLLGRFFDNI